MMWEESLFIMLMQRSRGGDDWSEFLMLSRMVSAEIEVFIFDAMLYTYILHSNSQETEH